MDKRTDQPLNRFWLTVGPTDTEQMTKSTNYESWYSRQQVTSAVQRPSRSWLPMKGVQTPIGLPYITSTMLASHQALKLSSSLGKFQRMRKNRFCVMAFISMISQLWKGIPSLLWPGWWCGNWERINHSVNKTGRFFGSYVINTPQLEKNRIKLVMSGKLFERSFNWDRVWNLWLKRFKTVKSKGSLNQLDWALKKKPHLLMVN